MPDCAQAPARITALAPVIATLAAAALALSAAAPSVAQMSDDATGQDRLYEEVMALRSSGNLPEARELLTQACELGDDLWACTQAAPMWSLGEGGRADPAIAKHQYDGMCALGNRAGCLAAELTQTHRSASPSAIAAAIGQGLYAEGQGLMGEDNNEGLNFLGLACQLNHAPACVMYGRSLDPISVFDSEGFEAACRGAIVCTVQPAEFYSVQDDPEAVWAFTRACDLGSGEGCLELGDVLNPTGLFGAPSTPENWRGAISAFQRACDEHQLADGCERYRRLMENRRNPETAAVLAHRETRCAEGDQPSCEIVYTERARMNAAAQGAPHPRPAALRPGALSRVDRRPRARRARHRRGPCSRAGPHCGQWRRSAAAGKPGRRGGADAPSGSSVRRGDARSRSPGGSGLPAAVRVPALNPPPIRGVVLCGAKAEFVGSRKRIGLSRLERSPALARGARKGRHAMRMPKLTIFTAGAVLSACADAGGAGASASEDHLACAAHYGFVASVDAPNEQAYRTRFSAAIDAHLAANPSSGAVGLDVEPIWRAAVSERMEALGAAVSEAGQRPESDPDRLAQLAAEFTRIWDGVRACDARYDLDPLPSPFAWID